MMSFQSLGLVSDSRLPPAVFPFALAVFLLFGFGPNLLLALLAILILLAGSALLWRPGESPILLLIFGYQWLQASIRIFQANFYSANITDLSNRGGNMTMASSLSLLALLALALGLRVGIGRWHAMEGQVCRSIALSRSIKFWFQLYILASVVAAIVLLLARYVPALSQPLLAAATLKWAFFWILAYATFVRGKAKKSYLLLAFLFEFAIGFGSYFADYRTVFLVTILAIAAAGPRISRKRLLPMATVVALLIAVSIVWTAVKLEYRYFLSGGQQAQVVTVSYGERVSKLAEIIRNLEAGNLSDAVEDTANRIGYVDFFADVLNRVPRVVPHENGAIWLDAISRPFMPRVLFPGKSAIHDSERTTIYTGLRVASYEAGTSISIGYIAETYIDFGAIGMMIVIFLYGFGLGRIYRFFLGWARTRGLLGMAFITSIFVGLIALESSITKVMGGLIASILVAYLFAKYLVPAFIPWLDAAIQGRRHHLFPKASAR